MSTPASWLMQIPFFAEMGGADALGGVVVEHHFDDGHLIMQQGSRQGGVFVVLSGRVWVTHRTPDGAQVALAELGPGRVCGILSVLDGGPHGASAVARGPVSCLEIGRIECGELLEGHGALAQRFQVALLRELSRDFRVTNRRLAELAVLPDSELAARGAAMIQGRVPLVSG